MYPALKRTPGLALSAPRKDNFHASKKKQAEGVLPVLPVRSNRKQQPGAQEQRQGRSRTGGFSPES